MRAAIRQLLDARRADGGRVRRRAPRPEAVESREYLAIASVGCHRCLGLGEWRGQVCGCALRGMFREVWGRWLRAMASDREMSVCAEKGWCYGRPVEEFLADVELTARRALRGLEWRIFDLHFVGGREWRDCCRRLGLDRGAFFHAVYRIMERLGRVWQSVRIWPLRDYFGRQLMAGRRVRYYRSRAGGDAYWTWVAEAEAVA